MPKYRVPRIHYFTTTDEVIVEADGSYIARLKAENTDQYPAEPKPPAYKRTSANTAYKLDDEEDA